MSDITTVKQHLDIILAKLQQEQTMPVVDHEGITTTTTVDMRNFAQLFLSNHLVSTVNQYGQINQHFTTSTVINEWHDHEIPYYDDETRYTPNETTPPPETCMATTWEEYSDIRCEVATKYVQKMMESICLGINMLIKYQALAVDVVKVILDGCIAVLATGTVVVTAGGGAPISIPVGLALAGVVEIIAMISKFIFESVGEALIAALSDTDYQQELICAVYNNKTPEGIKIAWDAKVEELYTGIPMFPIRKLLKVLMPNRHAFALAEGAGVRSIGADCGGCEPALIADFISRPAGTYTYGGSYSLTGAHTAHPTDHQALFGYNVVGAFCSATSNPATFFDLGSDGDKYVLYFISGTKPMVLASNSACSNIYANVGWNGAGFSLAPYRYLNIFTNNTTPAPFTVRLQKTR